MPDGMVLAGVRPESFVLVQSAAAGTLSATVELVEQLGPEKLAYLKLDDVGVATETTDARELRGAVIGRFDPNAPIAPGSRVELHVDPENVRLFDPVSGEALAAENV